MSREEILNKIIDTFRDVFGDTGLYIDETTCSDDVEGWDSMMQITLVEAIQGEFGISFSLDEIIELKDIGIIIETVEQKIK